MRDLHDLAIQGRDGDRGVSHRARLKTQQAHAASRRSRSPRQRSASPVSPKPSLQALPRKGHDFFNAQKEPICLSPKRRPAPSAAATASLSSQNRSETSSPYSMRRDHGDVVESTSGLPEHLVQVDLFSLSLARPRESVGHPCSGRTLTSSHVVPCRYGGRCQKKCSGSCLRVPRRPCSSARNARV